SANMSPIGEALVPEQRFVNAVPQRSLGVSSPERLGTFAGATVQVSAHCASHQSQRRRLREYHSIRQIFWRDGMPEPASVKGPDAFRLLLHCFVIGNFLPVVTAADGAATQSILRFPIAHPALLPLCVSSSDKVRPASEAVS